MIKFFRKIRQRLLVEHKFDKNFKKISFLILIALIFSGCGNKDKSGAPPEDYSLPDTYEEVIGNTYRVNLFDKEINSEEQAVLSNDDRREENTFIPTSILNQISVLPINDDDSYADFVSSARSGYTSNWLHINEMVNNFTMFQSEGGDLNLTHQLQLCPWNSANHLLLVNITNNSENDKFIKDLTIVINTVTVKAFRLLGFENPDKDLEREFDQGKSIQYSKGESFTMFYEVNLNNTSEPIGEIMLSFQNDFEGRVLQVNEKISSMDVKASNEFTFLASVVETTLFLNDSKYKSKADLKEVEKRLITIGPFLKPEAQKEFLQLIRLYIKERPEETL